MSDMFDPWHLVHVAWGTVAAIGAYVWRDHVKRDDARFKEQKRDAQLLGEKIDRHYENITSILLERLPPKK
jgi:hypothetical protein